MIDREKYVPILKCKAGEFIALAKLPDSLKNETVPIADLVPVHNKKSFVEHIKSSIGYIKSWGNERLLYIDGYMLQDTDLTMGRKKYMEYIFDELRKNGNNVIPVVSNISNLEYLEQVKNIIEKDGKGVCLRVFVNRELNINDEIERTIQRLGININQIDLLIDLQSVENLKIEEIYTWQKDILLNLVYSSSWRSLFLAGSSFPINLIKLSANQIHIIPRKHWLAWKQLINKKEIERIPTYSDYGISHPLIAEVEGIPNASASIRYTYESEYYIYRGSGTRQQGFEQFYDLSESLMNSNEFYGTEHCAGDRYINICGTKKEKPGSLKTWRWVGTCHHLTVVINQLRQFWRDFNAKQIS